ncbi:uncharacterized protein LOC108039819 [Drosophila rhopaloa]|uniref:Uncharacterized protein LOC108039819 n=1 Tax=Drosophila rhopaloa TaxID=1041015 RepID=A0A6P4E321_DRORH|nr:uncharacterized protein LOC108039819 [Drosophila rhopaloa]
MVWFIIVLLCLGNSLAQISDLTVYKDSELEERLLSLLQKLQIEQMYDTLLIYGEDCVFPSLFTSLPVSTVLVSSGSTNFDWNFSSLTLILSCGFQAEREENYRTLIKLQNSRRLILLSENIQPETVCDYYTKKEQYNIAMVKENFDLFGVVHSCRIFQERKYEKINLFEDKTIFKEQFRNMHGAPIRTLSDMAPPRSMVYRDAKTGEEKIIGFVANLIRHFVQKVNATMDMQVKLIEAGTKISFENISKWASEDLLDIGMSEATSWEKSNFDTLSYPYLMTSHCFMVPIPDVVPDSKIYMIIIDPPVLAVLFIIFCIFSLLLIYTQQKSWRGLSLSSVLLNDKSLRGFLGQPFPFPRHSSRILKLICLNVCFSSLMTTTMYTAYLQSLFCNPPLQPRLHNFGDLEKTRFKVAISSYEMLMLQRFNLCEKQLKIFDNSNQFSYFRNTFNTDYIYPVTSVRWSTFKEQQKLFAYPLFYYSDSLCLNLFDIFSFPIRRHLPYRDLFEEHILRQHEFGLPKYWIDRSFADMLRLKITPFEDLSPPRLNDKMHLDDLYWALVMFGTGLGISCWCFAIEFLGSPSFWRRLRESMWLRIQN